MGLNFLAKAKEMKKIMILVGSLIPIVFFILLCFGKDEIAIPVESVQNAKNIRELRNYLGIDDEYKRIKYAILERLDQFESEEDENESEIDVLFAYDEG